MSVSSRGPTRVPIGDEAVARRACRARRPAGVVGHLRACLRVGKLRAASWLLPLVLRDPSRIPLCHLCVTSTLPSLWFQPDEVFPLDGAADDGLGGFGCRVGGRNSLTLACYCYYKYKPSSSSFSIHLYPRHRKLVYHPPRLRCWGRPSSRTPPSRPRPWPSSAAARTTSST